MDITVLVLSPLAELCPGHIPGPVDGRQGRVQHLPGVAGRDADADALLGNGGAGVAHGDGGDVGSAERTLMLVL